MFSDRVAFVLIERGGRQQLALAQQLITPHDGSIVAVYHDIDVSRSLPWSRRPQATRLLADAADPLRGWRRLVIGEPQRAFSGPQFQLVFPVLSHFGIEFWVPEIGGPVDPDSEAHDLVMSLFGGLSKAERRRIQHRTRAAMLALAAGGRWLGGRPNYGYRVVNTGLPHPNRSGNTMAIGLTAFWAPPCHGLQLEAGGVLRVQ
jgi:site-specific DNA recombinase